MPQTAEELLRAADQLSPEDRDWLRRELSHPPGDGSTEAEREAAWSEEIQNRLDEIDSGAVEMIPHEEVMRELHQYIETLKLRQ
jgi:predicted transcriptional regulator